MENQLNILAQFQKDTKLTEHGKKSLVRLGIKNPEDSAILLLKAYYIKFCQLYDMYSDGEIEEMVVYYEKVQDNPLNKVKRMVKAAPTWKHKVQAKSTMMTEVNDGTQYLMEHFS